MHKVEFSLRDTGLAESSPYALPPGSPTETRAQSTRMYFMKDAWLSSRLFCSCGKVSSLSC